MVAPPAIDRSRAATRAQSVADEAESWITPPPAPVDRKRSGSPRASTIQSTTRVSTSVHAGPVCHSIPCTPRPLDTRSPRIAGPDVLAGKYAWNPGCCQWVVAGTTTRSRSPSTASNGSGWDGGEGGTHDCTSPGVTAGTTGCRSTVSRYSATQSTTWCPHRRSSSAVMWNDAGPGSVMGGDASGASGTQRGVAPMSAAFTSPYDERAGPRYDTHGPAPPSGGHR